MDRELQDEVIRYLAEAGRRTATPVPASLPLTGGEAQKAERFARFLARRYYRDRLHRSFRYSRQVGGQAADEVADSARFDAFLGGCVLGSLGAARRVGAMALDFLGVEAPPFPWWSDLLAYENAYFLQAATSERPRESKAPAPGVSSVCLDLEWNLPDLIKRLKDRTEGKVRRRALTLIFSRTEAGRIFVVEVDPTAAAVFRQTDGQRDVPAIAAGAGVTPERAQQILSELAAIGAVRLPS